MTVLTILFSFELGLTLKGSNMNLCGGEFIHCSNASKYLFHMFVCVHFISMFSAMCHICFHCFIFYLDFLLKVLST